MTADEILARLQALADETTATTARRFFKTGPGQYGEGDVFLGIKVPLLRKVAADCRGMPVAEAEKLLHSPLHECRMLALLVLVQAFARGDESVRQATYDLYLRNTARINNWDLVDCSAEHIVGGFLRERDTAPLYRLARSSSLWERRIAVLATFHFIRRDDFTSTFGVARLLLADKEDLIHKAVGWMLREVGKRDQPAEEAFLVDHYQTMPRTMLRYAIERFTLDRRRQYLQGEVG